MAVALGRRDLEDEALLSVGLAEMRNARHDAASELLDRVAASEENWWAAANAQQYLSLMRLHAGRIADARTRRPRRRGTVQSSR